MIKSFVYPIGYIWSEYIFDNCLNIKTMVIISGTEPALLYADFCVDVERKVLPLSVLSVAGYD